MADQTTKPSPANETASKVQKLAELPPEVKRAPRGPISPGGFPTEGDVEGGKVRRAAAAKHREGAKADEKLPAEHARELELLTVEALAEEAGYLPQMWKSAPDARRGRLRAVAPRINPKHWLYAGAKAFHQWPDGKEMTRSEFVEAIRVAHNHPIR